MGILAQSSYGSTLTEIRLSLKLKTTAGWEKAAVKQSSTKLNYKINRQTLITNISLLMYYTEVAAMIGLQFPVP